MGVDHLGADVLVTEELLDRADVVAGFQEVSREGVAEGVGRDVLGDSGGDGGPADLFLNDRLVKVVTAGFARARVDGDRRPSILIRQCWTAASLCRRYRLRVGRRAIFLPGPTSDRAGDVKRGPKQAVHQAHS